ncbi:hypothetical protein CS542_03330 [Pedobacter sp. IW39]|nr:hypothetical protein CS542_03330 [Pedobacter sp. IW39]
MRLHCTFKTASTGTLKEQLTVVREISGHSFSDGSPAKMHPDYTLFFIKQFELFPTRSKDIRQVVVSCPLSSLFS